MSLHDALRTLQNSWWCPWKIRLAHGQQEAEHNIFALKLEACLLEAYNAWMGVQQPWRLHKAEDQGAEDQSAESASHGAPAAEGAENQGADQQLESKRKGKAAGVECAA